MNHPLTSPDSPHLTPPPPPPPPLPLPLPLWEALVAADETSLDLDLLSAYAEGKLPDSQRAFVRDLIARSPRAMEMLDGIRSDFRDETGDDEHRRPLPLAAARPLTPAAPSRAAAPSANNWRRSIRPLLTAAVLLMAVGIAFQAAHNARRGGSDLALLEQQLNSRESDVQALRNQVAQLSTRLETRSREIATARTEQLYSVVGSPRPCLTRSPSPLLARLALAQDPTSRGFDELELDPRRRAQRAADIPLLLSEAEDSAHPAAGSGLDVLLDRAALELAAGNLDEAERLLDEAARPAVESAAIHNLRAAVLMTRAAYQSLDDAEQTLQQAAELLERAVALDPRFAFAWFNLALLREQQGNDEAAHDAWIEYVRHEADSELRELVRRSRLQ